MVGQPGFFDLDERYRALAETRDPLIKLAELIEFEVFRSPFRWIEVCGRPGMTGARRASAGSRPRFVAHSQIHIAATIVLFFGQEGPHTSLCGGRR